MDCKIYDPEVTTSLVVDTYDNPANLKWVADTSMAKYGGKLFAIMDGSITQYFEGAADQQIWMATSADGVTWSDPFQPFRSSTYCNNPLSGSSINEWQPSLVVVGSELWALWSSATAGFISKLTSVTGKWTNYRFEFLGSEMSLSSTISGSATGGRSLRPTIAGVSDFRPFPSGDPIILSNGVVACPGTMLSTATMAGDYVGGYGFSSALKYNVAFLCDDGTWSFTVIPNGEGNYTAWEPFFVENPVGHVYVFSRNLKSSAGAKDSLLVAKSTDECKSFSPLVSTKLDVPQTRGSAKRLSASRWVMAHCDKNRELVNPDRQNGSLFISRRGVDDFVQGVNFSLDDFGVKYPQFIEDDGELLINYTSGNAASNVTGKGRAVYRVNKLSYVPDDDHAFIHPRSLSKSRSFHDPQLVTPVGAPAYWNCDGYSRLLSASSALTPAAGLSFAAWVENLYDPPTYAGLIDTRDAGGSLFRINGISLGSMDLYHGWDLPLNEKLFLGASISNTGSVTFYAGYGQSDLVTKTNYFKSILFSGQPSNDQTIVINSVTYTFKTSASLTNDVQIGATATATCANLKAKVETNMADAGSNETTTYILDTRLLVTRPDGASFSASTSATNVAVESSVSLDGGSTYVGSARVASSVPAYRGHLYDARVYDGALSAANMRALFNERASEFGYSAVSGTSTSPSSPLLRANPASHSLVTWPSVGGAHYCEVVDEDTLRLHGESSASVELPYASDVVSIRYKLGNTPASTDKYVIATFGTSTTPVRLYISAANPTLLYLNDQLVGVVQSGTEWNIVSVKVGTNKVSVAGAEYYFKGSPRCYLGNAWPEGLLAASKSIDFNVSAMTVSRA